VTQYEHNLRSGYVTGELETAENIRIRNIPGHSCVEDIADAQIHNELGRSTGVDAAQNHRDRELTGGSFALLSQKIAIDAQPSSEPLIAVFHHIDNVSGAEAVSILLGGGQHTSCGEQTDACRAKDG
jgi:hypothetical protein